MNPFKQKTREPDSYYVDWQTLSTKPYAADADPYTKIRVILANGAEFDSVWFLHQFSRHCGNNELRRELAVLRRIEQQQQKRIAALKPIKQTILETTIGYEMLAVDLTAAMAKSEKLPLVKKALDFALLEDFDHLYRYADLLEGERGIKAEKLVGKHVEIMPGRPTIAEHRCPCDDIKPHITADAPLLTKLNVGIITAAEQQTMNYYMNVGSFYDTEAGRRLYAEIAMIEEQHVSHYGSLKDTEMTWLECLLLHEYTECYLYRSNYETETDEQVKQLWEQLYEQELSHLAKAARLLQKYEKKEAEQVIPNGNFPQLLKLEPSTEYVRGVLESVRLTALKNDYKDVSSLPDDAAFFSYQQAVNTKISDVPSHKTIAKYIVKNKKDYRFETKPHPIEQLRDRARDNTDLARVKQ